MKNDLKPVLFESKEECCGSGACAYICKQNAIVLELDDEGFSYPIIDEIKCVRCYQCLNICPIKNKM